MTSASAVTWLAEVVNDNRELYVEYTDASWGLPRITCEEEKHGRSPEFPQPSGIGLRPTVSSPMVL